MKKTTIVILSSVILFTAVVQAKSKPEDLIKYRQSAMMFMRWNMGTIKQVVNSPQKYNRERIVASATAIAAIANSNLEALFIPETATGKGWKATLVKPSYFEQSGKVKKYTDSFRKEANEMARVASNGDVGLIKAQFKNLLKACKSCHQDFRAKK